MNSEIQKYILEIVKRVDDKDFLEFAEDKIEKLESIDVDGESMESLLRLIENNPNVDFGMPGQIVHFLEKFYKNGYEEQLVASIRRQPVPHNIWMLNRVINGSQGNVKLSYISELDSVLSRSDISMETKEAAVEFRSQM